MYGLDFAVDDELVNIIHIVDDGKIIFFKPTCFSIIVVFKHKTY